MKNFVLLLQILDCSAFLSVNNTALLKQLNNFYRSRLPQVPSNNVTHQFMGDVNMNFNGNAGMSTVSRPQFEAQTRMQYSYGDVRQSSMLASRDTGYNVQEVRSENYLIILYVVVNSRRNFFYPDLQKHNTKLCEA